MSIRPETKAVSKKAIVFLVVLFAVLFGADRPTRDKFLEIALDPVPVEEDVSGYPIVKVTDGDTIRVLMDGQGETLRLIGINTPETVDPRRPVECFGREASERAKEILSGSRVLLESDPTQGDRDKYGRLLRYVLLPDGTNFNRKMIEEGYAYEYTYGAPYRYQAEFEEAERSAREARRGLWSEEICGGQR
ncbi:MAG: thermonuclease family protein [Candidatus Moranbacteria bacterium]|nr:thermonuclease family protein [Candidatus Moranbacteria bacterium]